MRRCLKPVVLIFLVLALCIPVNAKTITKTIDNSKKSVTVTVGNKYKFRIKGVKVKWKEKNAKAFTISEKGVFTPLKTGRVKIVYTIKGRTKTVSVKINNTDASPSEKLDMVWLSATGTKYHRINNCGTMNPNKARQVSLDYAINHGFTKCDNCFN